MAQREHISPEEIEKSIKDIILLSQKDNYNDLKKLEIVINNICQYLKETGEIRHKTDCSKILNIKNLEWLY